ncbi:hypothetical protein FACS1894170_10310 [Planctomycetales bacterium]|nr:hypothetical protein FACS1894170_10310 [Planctomycetales bacterium]
MKKRDCQTGIEISDADWQRFEKFLPAPPKRRPMTVKNPLLTGLVLKDYFGSCEAVQDTKIMVIMEDSIGCRAGIDIVKISYSESGTRQTEKTFGTIDV